MFPVWTMVRVWDGNSAIGAHVWSEIGHLICLRHLFISTTIANLKSFSANVKLAQPYLSYHLIKVPWCELNKLVHENCVARWSTTFGTECKYCTNRNCGVQKFLPIYCVYYKIWTRLIEHTVDLKPLVSFSDSSWGCRLLLGVQPLIVMPPFPSIKFYFSFLNISTVYLATGAYSGGRVPLRRSAMGVGAAASHGFRTPFSTPVKL